MTCPHFIGDEGPEGREEEESESVEEEEDCGRDQEGQPEPEEEVELLVDDVVGKHTDGVMVLSPTSNADLLKVAHREDGQGSRQGIFSSQRVLSQSHGVPAIIQEAVVEELEETLNSVSQSGYFYQSYHIVSENNLEYGGYQTQYLSYDVLQSVEGIVSDGVQIANSEYISQFVS